MRFTNIKRMATCLVLVASTVACHTAQGWNERGADLAKAGDYRGAIQAFGHAAQMDPKMAKAHYNMGIAYARINQPDQAVACFRRALDIDPTDTASSAWLTRVSENIATRR